MPSKARSKCDTCSKPLGKVKSSCSCKKYRFCDDTCYSLRPMRQTHREECERRTKERAELYKAQQKAARSLVKSSKAKAQPRDDKGLFTKTPKQLTPEEREKQDRKNIHSTTCKLTKKIKKYSKKLDKLRKPWSICVLLHKTEEKARSDPVLYKSKNFATHGPTENSHNLPLEDSADEATRGVNLSIEDNDEEVLLNRPRRPNYRCYICQKKTGPQKGFVCSGREAGDKCINGSACGSCINLDLTSFTKPEIKKIKLNWRCPLHKSKSTSAESDGSFSEPDETWTNGAETAAPRTEIKKKSRKMPIYKISPDLLLLLPEEIRIKETHTRNDLVKGVHAYIKENPALKIRDETSKKWMINPDERLAKVYGTQPFEALSGVQKFGIHAELIKNDVHNTIQASIPNSPTRGSDSGPSSSPAVVPTTSSGLLPFQRDRSSSKDPSDTSESDDIPEKETRTPKRFMTNPQRPRTTKSPPRLPRPPKTSKKCPIYSNSTPNTSPSKKSHSPRKSAPTSPIDISRTNSANNSPSNKSLISKNSAHTSPMSISPTDSENISPSICRTNSVNNSPSKMSLSPRNSAPTSPMSISPTDSPNISPSKMFLFPKNSAHTSPMSFSPTNSAKNSPSKLSLSTEVSPPIGQSSTKKFIPPRKRQENCVTCDVVLDYDAVGEDQVERCKACLKYIHKSCQNARSCQNCSKLMASLAKNRRSVILP